MSEQSPMTITPDSQEPGKVLWEKPQHRGIFVFFALAIPMVVASMAIFISWAADDNVCAGFAACCDAIVLLGLLGYIPINMASQPRVILHEDGIGIKPKSGTENFYSFADATKITIQQYYSTNKNCFGAVNIKGKKTLFFAGLDQPKEFFNLLGTLPGLDGKLEYKDYMLRTVFGFGIFYLLAALWVVAMIIGLISDLF